MITASVLTPPRRPDRTGGHRRVGAEVHLVLQQLLHARFVHDQQHEVGLFRAGLEPPAAFGDLHEHRRAPLFAGAAAHHALAVFAADDERRLLELRNHQHAARSGPDSGANLAANLANALAADCQPARFAWRTRCPPSSSTLPPPPLITLFIRTPLTRAACNATANRSWMGWRASCGYHAGMPPRKKPVRRKKVDARVGRAHRRRNPRDRRRRDRSARRTGRGRRRRGHRPLPRSVRRHAAAARRRCRSIASSRRRISAIASDAHVKRLMAVIENDRPLPRSDRRGPRGRAVLHAERQPSAAGAEEAGREDRHGAARARSGGGVQDPRAQHREGAQPAREVARDDPHGARAREAQRRQPRRASRSSSSSRRS